MTLRISYLSHQFAPETGAGAARVREMALRWQEQGARVTVITGMPNRPQGRIHPGYRGRAFMQEEVDGIRVLRSWLYVSPRPGFMGTVLNDLTFSATTFLNGVVRATSPDVLIASAPPFFPHVGGWGFSLVRRTPLVLELRDLWPDYLVGMGVLSHGLASRSLFALERFLLRRGRHTVVVTDSFRDRVIAKGVPPGRVSVIPNGVDAGQYYRCENRSPLEALVRGEEEFLVGYLGNFGSGQGLEAVMDAAEIVLRQDPRIRIVLAGDGAARQRIVDRAERLGLPNLSVHAAIPKEQTRGFYNACDACLVPLASFPILQETVPSKLFEVMACERPVIACLGGEGQRIIEESGGGLVASPGDAGSIAETILRMKATSADRRAAMGRDGRAYVTSRYDRTVLADRYLAILRNVADRVETQRVEGSGRSTQASTDSSSWEST